MFHVNFNKCLLFKNILCRNRQLKETILFKVIHHSYGPTVISCFLCFQEALSKPGLGRSTE